MYAEQPPFHPADHNHRVEFNPMASMVAEAAMDAYTSYHQLDQKADRCEPGSMERYYWRARGRRFWEEFVTLASEYDILTSKEVPPDPQFALELGLDPEALEDDEREVS